MHFKKKLVIEDLHKVRENNEFRRPNFAKLSPHTFVILHEVYMFTLIFELPNSLNELVTFKINKTSVIYL